MEDITMSFSLEQKQKALQLYDETKSVTTVIIRLGYPTRQCLYRWLREREAPIKPLKVRKKFINTVEHPLHPSVETKLNILHRCFELGENVQLVSEETGYSRVSIYTWRRRYIKEGRLALMNSKDIPRDSLKESSLETSQNELDALKQKMHDMQLEMDILKETIAVLKKDPGINLEPLKNREKVVIIDALQQKYSLPELLLKLGLSRSSYYYQKKIQKRIDKYASLKEKIRKIFFENRQCYGYRRIYGILRRDGIILSEKVIRRIMSEEGLRVPVKSHKRYSSYQGEITPSVENLLNRDFHADAPNKKWLTDITELSIAAGKVYLSALVDCFDGMIVAWKLGTSPNANLVNSMLEDGIRQLGPGEHPIVHTDRGCHYRWPGWIECMEAAHLTRSMSKKGCSPDNAACEGFWGRLKNEMFYPGRWTEISIDAFMDEVNCYIRWYNQVRIKESLGYLSPREYRQKLGLIA